MRQLFGSEQPARRRELNPFQASFNRMEALYCVLAYSCGPADEIEHTRLAATVRTKVKTPSKRSEWSA